MAKMAHASRVLHGSCTEVMVVLLPPDCLAQNVSLQVQQHNSNHSFLTAVVIALCVARRQPTNETRQVTLSFNSSYKEANFRDYFLVYDPTTGKTPVLVRSPKLSSVGVVIKFLKSGRDLTRVKASGSIPSSTIK